MNALESLIGSLGISLFGLVSVPVAGWLVDVPISINQNLGMNAIFFVLRFFWLYWLRTYFDRIMLKIKTYFTRKP